MITKDILRRIVIKQKDSFPKIENEIKREILNKIIKNFKDNRILVLSGIRRVGKSTLLKEIEEVQKNFCYVNFEDENFLDFRAQDFELLNEVLTEVYGKINIYFFDEIQNIDKFETFVRRLQDEGKKIVITGSNASLLSKEFGTRLTGRYKLFEVYPFSFREFVIFKGIKIQNDSFYLVDKKVQLIKLFLEYMENGGMPEYLKNHDLDYVKTVFQNILYRDIISRYAIKKQKPLREIVSLLSTNISSEFTYNSLKEDVKLSNAITVKEYISYLNNSYLFFEVNQFKFSLKKQLNLPKKIYLIDPVFHNFSSFNFSLDKGKILENLVFLELKRDAKEMYYYKDKNECDFVIKQKLSISEAIQVCYELNEKNEEREISGLIEAMEQFNLKVGLILTFEQEDEKIINNKKILIKPVWKWLLDKK
jgi:hypothetical protein